MTQLTYPKPNEYSNNLKENAQKLAYTEIVYEHLRLEHNKQNDRFRNGEITQQELGDWKDDWFEPRHRQVLDDKLELKAVARSHLNEFILDLEGLPKKVILRGS